MSAKRSRTSRKLFLILAILLPIFLVGATQINPVPSRTPALLFSRYRKYGKFLDAMAKYESGNYTNSLSTKYNNIFSMGFPKSRKATNIGKTPKLYEGQFMSVYRSRNQAVADLLLWFEYNNFPAGLTTVDGFVRALKENGYFAQDEDQYLNGIKSQM
jgi:hypothetical protein